MSLSYFGWEVTYDDASLSKELADTQEPKDQGVYTMYHGTSVNSARLIIANGFKQSSGGMLGKGVYVSRNMRKAQNYPLNSPPSDRVVLKLHVRVGRVKRIDKDNHPMQYTWSSQGYHTAWVPPKCGMLAVPSGFEEDCVFDPKRVELLDIAQAPDSTILNELKQRIASRSKTRPDDGTASVCAVCKRGVARGAPHRIERCWGCGGNICPLMAKHACRRT